MVAVRRFPPWLGLVFLGALAIACYAPYRERPFDIIDFSEILGLLSGGTGAANRLTRLVRYYGEEHGRFNILSYAGMVVKWQLFGANPLAWQLVRAVQLLATMAGTYLLCRRLAAGVWGGTLGAALVLFSFSASHGWVRLTAPEPLGLLCALGAALLATQVRASPHWKAIAIGSGVLMALAILAKEMLVAWVPVVVYLGCFLGEDGTLEPIRWPHLRGRWVALAVGTGAALAMMPVLYAVRSMKAQGYASQFGSGSVSVDRTIDIAQRMLFPWPAGIGGEGAVMLLPALCFVAAIVIGLLAARGNLPWASHAGRATVLGLLIPAIGTLIYTPWPAYWPSYGIPFLVGPGLLLAIAVTSAERASPRAAWAARASALLCLALVIGPSTHLANRMATRQELNAGLARALLAYPSADSVIVALVVPPKAATVGIGPAMRAYALILSPGALLPPVIDAQCADVAARAKRAGGLGKTVVLSYSDQCGVITGATRTLRQSFGYFELSRFRMARDSIRADLFDPMAPPAQ